MSSIAVAIIAYTLLAFVNLADKFVIEKVIPGPKTYTFLVGVAGGVVILAAPWFLNWPGWTLFFFNMMVGAFFTAALFFLFTALKRGEASRIFTLVGGITPIFTVLFSLYIFKEFFSFNQWLAIIFLIAGTIMISSISMHHNIWFNVRRWLGLLEDNKWPAIISAVISGLFFALFWVGSKQAFNVQEFGSAFIWMRLGTLVAVLVLLLRKVSRNEIFSEIKASNKNNKNNKFIVLGAQGTGALAGILQNYAVYLGSVSLVTSLQGLQYALLLILVTITTFFYPDIIKEKYTRIKMIKKVAAVLLVGLGLYLLVI